MLLNLSLKIVVLELYYPILSENMYNIHSNLLFWCRLLELQSAPLFTVEPHRRSRSVWDCTVLWNCRSFDIYIVFSSVILHLFPCVFQWKNVHIHCCNSNVTGRHETHSYSLSLLLTLWLCYCCAVQQQCTVNIYRNVAGSYREFTGSLQGV